MTPLRVGLLALGCTAMASCSLASLEDDAVRASTAPLVELLASGQVVLGIFSGEKTPDQGARMGTRTDVDFVFYSLERGPFDLPAMQAYRDAMGAAAGPSTCTRLCDTSAVDRA